jgi:phosphoglycolate phosphatase
MLSHRLRLPLLLKQSWKSSSRSLATFTSEPFKPYPYPAERLSNPGLVVFDKDGTLIDFQMMWGSWTEQFAWRLEMASKQPLREALFDALGYDYIRRRVHSGGALCCTPMRHLRQLGENVLKESALKLSQKEAEELVSAIWQMPDPVGAARPLADLPRLFSTLRSMNMKIAVCTTDDHDAAENTLKALNVRHLVDVIVGGDDPIPAKPSPEQLYHICYQCGVAPHDTIMVGDTSTDMKLGQAAGAGLSVGVLDGASSIPDLAQYADVLVPSVAKLPKIAFQWSLRARAAGQGIENFTQVEWEDRRKVAAS